LIEINLILKDEFFKIKNQEYIIYYKLKKYIKIIFFYFFKFIKNDKKYIKKSKFYTLTHAKPINVWYVLTTP